MKEKSSSFQLLEPTRPEALVPQPWLEPWMWVIAALVISAIFAVWWYYRSEKKFAITNPLLARNKFHQDAVAALEKMNPLHARDAAVQASLILRKYLALAAKDPALFETNEEFISRHDALQALTETAREASGIGFTRLASLKYAAEVPDLNPAEVVNESRTLLETLHHGFAT